MKQFLKMVLANITAILLLGGLFIGSLLFFLMLGALSGESKRSLPDKGVLTFDNDTRILDSPTEVESGLFNFSEDKKTVTLLEALEAIKRAKTDDHIKGISLEADFLNANMTHLDDLRSAIEDFKQSKKFVFAYGNAMSQSAYYLNTIADKVYLNPVGGLELKGMGTEVYYFKEFLDKYGICMQVIRHGKYKAAVEGYLLNEMSQENQTQLSTLLGDLWSNIMPKMAARRGISPEKFNQLTDSLAGSIAEEAQANKLVDELAQYSQYTDALKSRLNLDKDDELERVPLQEYVSAKEKENREGNIAVLNAAGIITGGDDYSGISSEKYREYIQDLAEDEDIKAVVLRVNSPGGSANASDEILYELQQLGAKKPLVVSFGDYAASGGYYISMAARRIFTEPNTVTGSIGVFGTAPFFKDIANKNGIRAYQVNTNANAQYYSPVNGFSPGGISMMTRSVENTYRTFVSRVMQKRKMTFAQVDSLGGGHVWSGTRAVQNGLADQIGTLQDAISHAAKLVNLKDYTVATYPAKKSPFEEFFKDLQTEAVTDKIIERKIGKEKWQMINQMVTEDRKGQVMMQLPFQLNIR